MLKPETILKALPSIIWSVVGLCCIALAFQVSSAVKHMDDAAVGVAHTASTVLDQAAPAVSTGFSTVNVHLSASLTNLDSQIASIGPVVKKAGPILDNLAADANKLGESIDAVNRSCAPGPCGTLPDLAKTLNTVRMTFGQVEVAANHEDKNLTNLDAQENKLFEDFDGTATRMNTSLDTFNAQLANPNLALMMQNGGSITTTLDQVSKKLAQCTLHPNFGCVVKSDALFGAQMFGYAVK